MRSTLAAYANDLLSLGVDGLRLDAAKSVSSFTRLLKKTVIIFVDIDINNSDIANITSRFTRAPYITQEVIWGEGQPVTPNQYAYIGTDSMFGLRTRHADYWWLPGDVME